MRNSLKCLAMMAAVATSGKAVALTLPPVVDAAERRIAIERLAVVGSALYVAAHPDDENGALLAYLAKGRKVRAAYLSLTRGDGGQNLIGTEQGELLGVLRTEELLDARRVDGAEQFFTRAVDFGYSKTPEETLRIWGHDAVLADVVWVIRSFRPDVIITRFPANGDGGHGHHTASAILAAEAFTAAADPARFPEQLALVKPWQAKRLLWNAWTRPGQQPSPSAKPRLTIDLGSYDPLLGEGWAEIAAASRTMHKSQGGAIPPRRGSIPNEFELVAGEPAKGDLFDGVDLTWKRVAGGEAVEAALHHALASYSDEDPTTAVPGLLDALTAIDHLADEPWLAFKRREVLEAIRQCTGLWLDAAATDATGVPGAAIKLSVTALNRSVVAMQLVRVELPSAAPVPVDARLAENAPITRDLSLAIPREAPLTQPYWLAASHGDGTYASPEQALVGAPHSPPAIVVTFVIRAGERELRYEVPVTYRWLDPVEGQRTREVAIVPRVTVNLEAPVLLFPDRAAKVVRATVQARAADTAATVELQPPQGWRAQPDRIVVTLAKAGEERLISFTLSPPATEGSGQLAVTVTTDRREPARAFVTVDHPHIEPQTLLPPATARLVRVDVARPVRRIGYVMGAGDEVPAVLHQLGFDVTLLSDDDLVNADLSGYGTIVTGVRAYNTRNILATAQERLLAYVQAGGSLLIQYNTNGGLITDKLGPYPLTIGRDRTTDETAAVRMLGAGSPWLTKPHALGTADFAGWVQERGLYYATTWDPRYQALLAMADPGETPTQGALLVTSFGKGTYIYTGLAFFRQLPAGVPGAIKLFANLLSGGRG
ncbi:MAG: PIG-L family deacetylase [Thermoanaerobaculales bacterium]